MIVYNLAGAANHYDVHPPFEESFRFIGQPDANKPETGMNKEDYDTHNGIELLDDKPSPFASLMSNPGELIIFSGDPENYHKGCSNLIHF